MTARPPSPHDDALDAAARRAHAASLGHLSPRVQAQLAQRRRAALAGGARAHTGVRGLHWLAGSVAAAGALALGLQLMRAPDAPQAPVTVASLPAMDASAPTANAPVTVASPIAAQPVPATASAATPDPIVLAEAADTPSAAEADAVLAAAIDASTEAVDAVASEFLLEDDPDFYLWLASVDASELPPEIP